MAEAEPRSTVVRDDFDTRLRAELEAAHEALYMASAHNRDAAWMRFLNALFVSMNNELSGRAQENQ